MLEYKSAYLRQYIKLLGPEIGAVVFLKAIFRGRSNKFGICGARESS